MLARALARRCLVCGAAGIFTGWFTLRDACPGCGHSFEREEGYWVGAMIMNTAGAQLGFFILLLGGMALFWPEVPWTGLLVAGLVYMGGFPVVFYPFSKTLWMWCDFVLHPLDDAR